MRKRVGIVQPLLLAAIVALGFGVVWGVLVSWGAHTAKDIFGPEPGWEYVQLRMDGTPIVVHHVGRYSENNTYRTLEGTPIAISRQEALLWGSHLTAQEPADPFAVPLWNGGSPWKQRISGYNDGGQPATYWYFVLDGKDRDAGYFVGFDSVGKRRLGYIGRSGFRSDALSPDEYFAVHGRQTARQTILEHYYGRDDQEPWYPPYAEGTGRVPGWVVYALTDDGLAEVDLLKRSTRMALNAKGIISAGHLNRGLTSPTTTDSDGYRSQVKEFLAVRMNDRIEVLDYKGNPSQSLTIPAEYREAAFTLYLLHDGSAILQVSCLELARLSPGTHPLDRLVWIDAKGKVLRQKEYAVMVWDWGGGPKFSPWRSAFCAPAPIVIATLSTVLQPWISLWLREDPNYADALLRSWCGFWLPLVITCVVGIVVVWLCRRRQQKYGLPWTGVWTSFVLLFGLPGYIGYLAHRPWPSRLPCPHCGRKVPRDRPACFACGKDFPAPAAKGIEVFA
jgi:hypothetical protein